MAWQLIYTSAPRGLVPGRSGFCTVARHREIRDGLVTAIERFSQYDRSGRDAGTPSPVIYAHRIVRLGGSSYHVLSCTGDAGADYTGRTNHLAHHLICEPHELASAPSPAEVLRQMAWCRTWTDEPRYLGAEEVVQLGGIQRSTELPAKSWQTLTGDAGCAALPLESGALAGCYWLYPAAAGEQYLLPLFAESLLLLDPSGRNADKLWQVPFTTYLQATDHAADFFWRGCWHGSPAALAAQNARQTLDLSRPHDLRAPQNSAAELARTGRTASPVAAAAPAPEPPASAEPVAPGAPARPAPAELDLASLLESADTAGKKGGRWAKSASPERRSDGTADRNRFSEKKRGLPVKLILAAAAALVLCGALAIGFIVWRDGKAEALAGELRAARNSGDFASGSSRVAKIGGIFRSYEPLRIEIERTQIASELDALKDKTPEDADRYLSANGARLNAPAIQNDFQLKERLGKLDAWRKAGARVAELARQIEAEPPVAARDWKKALAEEEKAAATLDAPYRAAITHTITAAKQRQAQRRIEALEQAAKAGKAPPNLEVVLVELRQEVKRLGMAAEWIERLDLYRPAPRPPEPKPEPVEKPLAQTPVKVQATEISNPSGLPRMPTYLAVNTGAGFDVSAVAGRRGRFSPPDKWLLFRSPEPLFDPQGKGEICEIYQNGKLYDGNSNPILTMKPPLLSFAGDKSKLSLTGNFVLRSVESGGAADIAQIVVWQSNEVSASVIKIPIDGNLVRRGNLVSITDKLTSALDLIKPASTNANFVFKRNGKGFAAASCSELSVDLSHEMEAATKLLQQRKGLLAGPQADLEKAQEIESARARLFALLEHVGLQLFRGFTRTEKKNGEKREVPVVDGKNPASGIRRFLEQAGASMSFEKDQQLFDYLQQVVMTLRTNAPASEKDIKLIYDNVEHEWNNLRNLEELLRMWKSLGSVAGSSQKLRADAPRTPLEVFAADWSELFRDNNAKDMLIFFRNSGIDAVKGIKDAESRMAPHQAEIAKAQKELDRLEADLRELGPFFLDLEFRGPNPSAPVQVVRLAEFSGVLTKEPAPAK